MKSSHSLLLLLLTVVFITSCKKSVPKETRFIPKNAVFVATINAKAMQSKLAKNKSAIENIIKNISGSDTTISRGKKELEDLKSSGVDFDENLYLAVIQKGGGMATGKGSMITSAIGTLNDPGKLEAYIKKKDPASEIRKEKDYSYTTIHGDKMVAWKKDVVIIMSSQRSMADMEYDSISGSFNLRNPGAGVNDMKQEIEADFNLKEDQSVASIPEFRDLLQEKSDVSIWANSSGSVDDLPLPLPKLKELLSNSFTAAKLDFEDGKIIMNSKSYYSSQFRDILKNYTGSNADLGLVENYPSDDINGFGVFSFNPQLIDGIVKYLEVGGLVDSYLTKMMGSNYTLQDALKAIKGDLAVTVSDFKTTSRSNLTLGTPEIRPGSDTLREIRPEPKVNLKLIVNIPIGDKIQMNRIMDKLVEMQMLVKTNNEYRLNSSLQKVGYQLRVDDKNVIVASDEDLLNQYIAKKKKANLNKDIIKDFKGKSGLAYVNIESILNGIDTSVTGQRSNVLAKAKETFKYFEGYTENFNGKFLESRAELHFKNEKENSLASLLGFIETASKYVKTNPAMVGAPEDVRADTVWSNPNSSGVRTERSDVHIDTAYETQSTKATSKRRK